MYRDQSDNSQRAILSPIRMDHLRSLAKLQSSIPRQHAQYLSKMKSRAISPQVIFDVGSNVLHWTREARTVWPHASYFAFEAMQEVADIYDEESIRYHLGVLSDRDDREVKFYVSPEHPSGNSYYRENPEINLGAKRYFLDSNVRVLKALTLDTVVLTNKWPMPHLIKMDVQGAEMDVLKGAQLCLQACSDVILELQTVEYNCGAPLRDEVVAFMENNGFTLQDGPFHSTKYDGDYHFVTRKEGGRSRA